jgi:hypothetical protein
MQLHSIGSSQAENHPKETIPYSLAALRQDLDRLRGTWDDCQANRDRNAIYGYLTAVYGLVAWWTSEGRDVDRARRALRLQRLNVSEREDPFAASFGARPTRPRLTSGPGDRAGASFLYHASRR